jgi:chromosome segregation ATPase
MSQQQPSMQALLEAITRLRDELSQKIEAVQADFLRFQASMPDAYVPRREVEQRVGDLDRRIGNQDTRLTAMEEWRLAETRRAAEMQASLQVQIQSAALQAIKESAAQRTEIERDVHETRTALDGRAITQYAGWLTAIVIALLYIFAAHITLH